MLKINFISFTPVPFPLFVVLAIVSSNGLSLSGTNKDGFWKVYAYPVRIVLFM